MTQQEANYTRLQLPAELDEGKTFLGADLGLTATEISRTVLGPGHGSPFVHAHRQNEEVYIVTQGRGRFYLDGEEIPIQEGMVVRVACAARRAICASDDQTLVYYCIQAKTGSLVQATKQDGYKLDERASWMRDAPTPPG